MSDMSALEDLHFSAILDRIGHQIEAGRALGCVALQCFDWRLQESIAHNLCYINYCYNEKRNKTWLR